ncbi:hypothetical protein ACPRNU_12645 [Chromobacterium vaccinii]|uniref:hypothetical protein n=1 Tax=Chromobacterium vaccinii TaxID=1108595 RepID=UPI003C785503
MEQQIQCTRCRNKHTEADRVSVRSRHGGTTQACPRCGGHSYYDLTTMAAWCWASGLIEFGNPQNMPEGAIQVATGAKSWLPAVVSAVARMGLEGQMLVPGVPEAAGQRAAAAALDNWLRRCSAGNGQPGRHGVIFTLPPKSN